MKENSEGCNPRSPAEKVTQFKLYTRKTTGETNPASLEILKEKIDNDLFSLYENKLLDFAMDNEDHIFNLNSSDTIDRKDVQAVMNAWPVKNDHPIVSDSLVKDIISKKQQLKQDPNKAAIPWKPMTELGPIMLHTRKNLIPALETSDEAKKQIMAGYENLCQKIGMQYNGKVTSSNATFLEQWALTSAYLKMGIPVWESDLKSTKQTRENLGPHKLRGSNSVFKEEAANKVLDGKEPGFYAFVVPLSFPFKKKIMIGPKPNIATTHLPTESEGHSALSTKDNRKQTNAGVIKGVLFAGQVTLGKGGQVIAWTNDSGHYKISRKGDSGKGDNAGVLTGKALDAMGFPFPIEKYKDI